LSTSFYGTSDQGGNVLQWVLHSGKAGHPGVGSLRGVPWGPIALNIPLGLNGAATNSYVAETVVEFAFGPSSNIDVAKGDDIGFRMASIPEPSTLVLATIGLAAMFLRRRFRAGRTFRKDPDF
jgi:hypothetical protein